MSELQHQPSDAPRIIFVPVSRLSPIANGVRKTNGVSIDDLAASIKAEGLIQNLTVMVDPSSPLAGSEEFQRYIVVAGTRRLKALRKLVDDKALLEDHQVPCRVIDAAQALTVSTAENAIRVNMHPADEFTAFRDMVEQKNSVEDIAARFGTTPIVVQRRLKLANVSPKIFELFRTTSDISLEQMMALAIVDDHKAQENAWFKARGDYDRRADQIRTALTKKEISFATDPIARFVGRKAYEQAGGAVHNDLFNENGGYATDATLLRTLAAKRLEERAELVRKEAWSFVEVRPNIDYSELHSFNRAEPIGTRKPDDAEKKAVATLEKERKQLQQRREQLDTTDAEEAFDGEFESIDQRISEIHVEQRDLEEARKKWDPKVLAKGGAVVTIENGRLNVLRGLVKGKVPVSKPAKSSAPKANAKAGEAPTEQPGHSAPLVEHLSQLATYAVAAELVANPGMAIIALTHKLASDAFYERGDIDDRDFYDVFSHPVKISRAQGFRQIIDDYDEVSSADVAKLMAEKNAIAALLPERSSELLAWLMSKGAPVSRILAFCVATCVDGMTMKEAARQPLAPLAQALKLDMATRWTARAENYLSKISADSVRAAMAEAGATKADIAATAKMKKPELIASAEPLLGRTNWLPRMLRFEIDAGAKK